MFNFLAGGGSCAELIRAHDWSASPLGPPEQWDPVLKATLGTMLGSLFPKCMFWGPDLIMLYNDGYAPMLGRKPMAIGQPMREVWSDIWDQVEPMAKRALAGEPTFIEDYEITTDRNGYPEQAWFTFCLSPVRDEFGTVFAVFNTVVETTQTVLAKQRIELVNNELAHRMKNTFSVVNAIAAQTFGMSEDKDAPQTRFASRLSALAKAQDVLIGGTMGRAGIRQIVEGTLAAHLPDRDALFLEGPDWQLTGRQVFALALALHELATNAVKYGAFGKPTGSVAVRWSGGAPGSDEPFEFLWQESGVGPVQKPSRNGFGSRLITRILPSEFGGDAEIDYGTDGVTFSFTTTMRKLSA